jgi:FkbM family methyltransferase
MLKHVQDDVTCKLCKLDMAAFDIGANVGYYTLLLSRLVGPTGKVHSFEPNPETAKLLRKGLQANKIRNVEVYEMALGNRNGHGEFQYESSGDCDATLAEGIYLHKPKHLKKVITPMVTLDNFVQSKHINKVDFVKIDTQGADLLVLQGMRDVIRRCHPIIICEMIGDKQIKEGKSFLETYGYSCRELQGGYASYPQPMRFTHILATPSREL